LFGFAALVGWLIGCLVGLVWFGFLWFRLVSLGFVWLVCFLVGWFFGLLVFWLVGWLVGWSVGWLDGWLVSWLVWLCADLVPAFVLHFNIREVHSFTIDILSKAVFEVHLVFEDK